MHKTITVGCRKATGLILILWTVGLLSGCRNEATTEHDHEDHDEHEHTEAAHAPNEIHFTPEQAAAVGLTTETAAPGDFASVVRVSGRLQAAGSDEQQLTATAAGVVSYAGETPCAGRAVRRGETLYYITVVATSEGDLVTNARSELAAARADYERAQRLQNDQLITARDFEAARLRYEQAEATYRGVTHGNQSGRIAVTAPADGYLRNTLVQAGSYVSIGQPLATVAQNHRLLLQAEVPDRYYTQLAGITDARFRLTSGSEIYTVSALGGHLTAVAQSSDNGSPYLPVSFELNATPQLLPGAYADIWLLGAIRTGVYSVPTEALSEEQGLYYVYLRVDEDGYRKQEVKLGENGGDRVEIVSGLKAGDEVVTVGAHQVKLAAFSGTVPGHNHNH
jgi:RND family efflux transporter MFP subunit